MDSILLMRRTQKSMAEATKTAMWATMSFIKTFDVYRCENTQVLL